ELAERVQYHHVPGRPRPALQLRAAAGAEARRLHEGGHLRKALGGAWRDDEHGLAHALPHLVEGLQHELVLAGHRRARDPERPAPPPGGEDAGEAERGPARLHRVELQVTGDGDALRRRAHLADPLRVRLALHQEEVDLGEHAREPALHEPVAREGPRGDAAVHEGDPRPAGVRLVDEVRPELRLHEEEERGVDGGEDLAHGAGEVEGGVEEPVYVPDALLGDRVAGHRGRREVDAVAREALLERGDQRSDRVHLAHGDGMDPDRAVAVEVQVDGQAPHPLAERAEVLAGGAALPEEPGQGEEEAEGEAEAVEVIQVAAVSSQIIGRWSREPSARRTTRASHGERLMRVLPYTACARRWSCTADAEPLPRARKSRGRTRWSARPTRRG